MQKVCVGNGGGNFGGGGGTVRTDTLDYEGGIGVTFPQLAGVSFQNLLSIIFITLQSYSHVATPAITVAELPFPPNACKRDAMRLKHIILSRPIALSQSCAPHRLLRNQR